MKFYDILLDGHYGGEQLGVWQLCPKCNGQGTVSKPPYVAGDIDHWSSGQTSWTCDVCNGAKILSRPLLNKDRNDERSVATGDAILTNPDNQNPITPNTDANKK